MTIHDRKDYRPFGWMIENLQLDFELQAHSTRVRNRMVCAVDQRSDALSHQGAIDKGFAIDKRFAIDHGFSMTLDGEELELESILLNDHPITPEQYELHAHGLSLRGLPPRCVLDITVRINPAGNHSLSGLYQSGRNLLTQCEAEGFRRITFFPDRPDVMTRYRVSLRADPKQYPVLLANGNLIKTTQLSDGRIEALWDDPFPKPSYLFAMVAGHLIAKEARIHTASGKEVLLQVWVEPGNEDKTDWCMNSLQKALRWDERRFGLELDLERFMIVATADFNMGAMENKGLNIFNTKYVFAHPSMATDADFAAVESVVGHEYFHNWTGNRITCRDWFQLTLKEGLTVFRDQEFSADMAAEASEPFGEKAALSARAVLRIGQIRTLKTLQFPEDAGPMAHPIRPESYSAIDNFYTMTVYEKGAEVIRMLQTLLGPAGFRAGFDRYIHDFDGQAVSCDDFLDAMAKANDCKLDQFALWYASAGTPILECSHSREGEDLVLRIQQRPPRHRNPKLAPAKEPLLIPLMLGFGSDAQSELWEIKQWEQTRRFPGKAQETPSILRGFSAPVIVHDDLSMEQVAELAQSDADPVNRWTMMQRLMGAAVLGAKCEEALIKALKLVLSDPLIDPAYASCMLSFPPEMELAQQIPVFNPQALRHDRQQIMRNCARALSGPLETIVRKIRRVEADRDYDPNPRHAGERALGHAALLLWSYSEDPVAQDKVLGFALAQCVEHSHMSDRASGMAVLIRQPKPIRDAALKAFEKQFADEPLAMDRWLTLQATRHRLDGEAPVLDDVIALSQHPCFSMRNPNKVRALITSFCHLNLAEFHEPSAKAYAWFAETFLALDAINPQIAARLVRALDRWPTLVEPTRTLAKACLERLAGEPALSADSAEIIHSALKSD